MSQNQKKPAKSGPVPIPRENPFRAISKMFRNSIGKLPAHLVIIFFIALGLTVLCGVVMKFAEDGKDTPEAYLVKRLEIATDKPALTEAVLRGVWVHEADDIITTIKLGNGVFELISRYGKNPVARQFIRGGYRFEGNVLILQQRRDFGTPYDSGHLEYKFYPLEFTSLNLYAENDGRVMTWSTPAGERNRLKTQEPVLEDIFGTESAWVKIAAAP